MACRPTPEQWAQLHQHPENQYHLVMLSDIDHGSCTFRVTLNAAHPLDARYWATEVWREPDPEVTTWLPELPQSCLEPSVFCQGGALFRRESWDFGKFDPTQDATALMYPLGYDELTSSETYRRLETFDNVMLLIDPQRGVEERVKTWLPYLATHSHRVVVGLTKIDQELGQLLEQRVDKATPSQMSETRHQIFRRWYAVIQELNRLWRQAEEEAGLPITETPFDPLQGQVIFLSAREEWGFTLPPMIEWLVQMAQAKAQKKGGDLEVERYQAHLQQRFWEPPSDTATPEHPCARMLIQSLEQLWWTSSARNWSRCQKMMNSLGIKWVPPAPDDGIDEFRSMKLGRRDLFSTWLPMGKSVWRVWKKYFRPMNAFAPGIEPPLRSPETSTLQIQGLELWATQKISLRSRVKDRVRIMGVTPYRMMGRIRRGTLFSHRSYRVDLFRRERVEGKEEESLLHHERVELIGYDLFHHKSGTFHYGDRWRPDDGTSYEGKWPAPEDAHEMMLPNSMLLVEMSIPFPTPQLPREESRVSIDWVLEAELLPEEPKKVDSETDLET